MRVKIIDEYNRIPTKTQSALLSLMAEGYAEMFEQVVECGWSAWYLTANDDLGGGTFPVIEALRDRIDVVARCTAFNSHYLDTLVDRVRLARRPLEYVPADVVFSTEELEAIEREIRATPVPAAVLDLLGFFAGQLDFCKRASTRVEFMNKDTLHLAGRKVSHVCNEDCPLDKLANPCSQTENGISARALQTLILFSKAIAYFRGAAAVDIEDVRQILPWVLHDKLRPNLHSAFFQRAEHHPLQNDRSDWIRRLFDQTRTAHAAYAKTRPPVAAFKAEAAVNLDGLARAEVERRLRVIRDALDQLLKRSEMNGSVYEDVVLLKSLHCRYENLLSRPLPSGAP
jgi:MoxR-like ATPase